MVQDSGTSWGGMQEVLSLVAERPIVGSYLLGLTEPLRQLGEEATQTAQNNAPDAVLDSCIAIVERCRLFSDDIQAATHSELPEVLSPEDEDRMREALPQFSAIRHMMSNLVGSVEMLASTAILLVDRNHHRLLRRQLREIIDRSREIHSLLGLS